MNDIMIRAFDIFIATILLLLFWPLILVVALLARFKLGKPVLFRQSRPGLHGKPFVIYKFRTMKDGCDDQDQLLSDEMRMTSFGEILRKYSLDEWPQLWNVLKGDLSLVGPRPLLIEYLPRYTPIQARRHEVRPGITGWAQVNGRNAMSWEASLALDVVYVDRRSLWFNIKILCLTFLKVIKADGVSQPGHATKEKFTGSKHA